MKEGRPRYLLLLVLAIVALAYLQLPLLNYNSCIGADIYGDIYGITYNADLLNQGLLPYRQSLEYKMPGAFFIFAWVFELLGRSLTGVWLLYIIWQAAIILVTYLIALRFLNGAFAFLAAFIQIIFSLNYSLGGFLNINYSFWMMLPYLLAFYFFVRAQERQGAVLFFLSGVMLGLSLLIKRAAVLNLLCFLLYFSFGGGSKQPLKPLVALILGALTSFIPLVAFYTLRAGTPELFNGIFNSPWGIAAQRYLASGLAGWKMRLIGLGAQRAGYLLFFLLLSALLFWRLKARPRLLLIWFFCSHLYLASLRFYAHYFIQSLPAISILAALTIQSAWGANRKAKQGLVIGVLAAFLFFFLASGLRGFKAYRREIARNPNAHKSRPAVKAAFYIKANCGPDERIYALGKLWEVYFYSQRMAFTRMFKDRSVILEIDPDPWGRAHFKADRKIREIFIKELKQSPPEFLALKDKGFSSVDLSQFSQLQAIIRARYRQVRVFEDRYNRIKVYKRGERFSLDKPGQL